MNINSTDHNNINNSNNDDNDNDKNDNNDNDNDINSNEEKNPALNEQGKKFLVFVVKSNWDYLPRQSPSLHK